MNDRYQTIFLGSSKEIQQDKDHTHKKSRPKHVFAKNQIIKILKNNDKKSLTPNNLAT